MPFTREDAYRTLAALEPAPIFLQSYQMKRLPENLDVYFGPPEEFFIAPDIQEVYTQGYLVPVLDDGNFDRVTFCDPDSRTLVQMHVEEPEEKKVFYSWQQYLAHLMIRLSETIDSLEAVRRLGAIIQFSHMKEFEEYLERSVKLAGHDDWWAARSQFPLSIDPRR